MLVLLRPIFDLKFSLMQIIKIYSPYELYPFIIFMRTPKVEFTIHDILLTHLSGLVTLMTLVFLFMLQFFPQF